MIELEDLIACISCGAVVHLRWAKTICKPPCKDEVYVCPACRAALNQKGAN